MVTYQQLGRDPISCRLFRDRIKTVDEFRKLQEAGAAFVVLDTEHFPVRSIDDRVFDQVGLAYAKSLEGKLPRTPPRLQEFCDHFHVKVASFNIDWSDAARAEITNVRGSIPVRRAPRFGQEKRIPQPELEAAILGFIEDVQPPSTSLVLLGFNLAAEWDCMFSAFPELISRFTAWVDLRDIGHDIAPIGYMPGLVAMLQNVGYHWKDIRFRLHGKHGSGLADNAGNDALTTLALAQALLRPENHERLVHRQKCAQIAQDFTRKAGHWDLKSIRSSYVATIESSSGTLPHMLNSGMRLARTFFDHSPSSVGTISPFMAFAAFSSQGELDDFIQVVDESILVTADEVSVKLSAEQLQCSSQNHKVTQNEKARQRNEKQQLRETQRAGTSTESDTFALEDLFS